MITITLLLFSNRLLFPSLRSLPDSVVGPQKVTWAGNGSKEHGTANIIIYEPKVQHRSGCKTTYMGRSHSCLPSPSSRYKAK